MGKGLAGIAENVTEGLLSRQDEVIVEQHIANAKLGGGVEYFRELINKGRPDISKSTFKKKKKRKALDDWIHSQELLRAGLIGFINR